jgi:hypothetical protein
MTLFQVLTVEGAAKLLGLSPATVQRWRNPGAHIPRNRREQIEKLERNLSDEQRERIAKELKEPTCQGWDILNVIMLGGA